MHGVSRGGMMTFRALAAGLRVRAAATVGAPADLAMGLTHRPEMEEVYRDLMPGYATRKAEHLRARSVGVQPLLGTTFPATLDRSRGFGLVISSPARRATPSTG